MFRSLTLLLALLGTGLPGCAASLTTGGADAATGIAPAPRAGYYWTTTQVGGTAQILTMFCAFSEDSQSGSPGDVPLVAVLRDTLGDSEPENDRLTYVWLLSYQKPNIGQRLLSAVPFFYWRPGPGSGEVHGTGTAPLLNVSSARHPMLTRAGADILQWTILDPAITPVRATTRAYRTNDMDHERLHLEEAISYLREAPISDGSGALNASELNTVIARLELRKRLLGGLVGERQAERFGKEEGLRYERARTRDWELLRQCAEKTGLYFEPLDLAGTAGQYGMLWFPLDAAQPSATPPAPIWKLLSIKNPWSEPRAKLAAMPTYTRQIDEQGMLLSAGSGGANTIRLAPLAVYALTYPKSPLLLLDFRDRMRVRWREMTQRSIDEVTSGLIGISHYTNWYYYVGAAIYDFVAERHGAAVNRAERLDCYSQFRVKLALDRQLDPKLRADLDERMRALALNPLEVAPEHEMTAAAVRYQNLVSAAAPGGRLARQLEKDRREELASFGGSSQKTLGQDALHAASLGLYTRRTKSAPGDLETLDRNRRFAYQLKFLAGLTDAGTPPEVAYDAKQIASAVTELGALMPAIHSARLRAEAGEVLGRLHAVSQDASLQADCSAALEAISRSGDARSAGIAARPVALRSGGIKTEVVK